MNRTLEDVLKQRGIPYRSNVSTATLCTFRIGGIARLVIEPQCMGELIAALCLCREHARSYAVIGRGSNLLFDDNAIDTVLIRTAALDAVRILANGRIVADCGVPLGTLSATAARAGLAGLAFACGIPGTVGGALYMNAGAHGKCMLDLVETAEIWNPELQKIETLFNHQLNNSYRNSAFKAKNTVVLRATLALLPDADPAPIFAEMRALLQKRNTTQPTDLPSAGSVFCRPAPDVPLSRIMDELGLKGLRVGGAMVSPKHAGFIVNTGSATANDVRALIEQIQNILEREKGFRPVTEIRRIPEDV